MKLPGTPPTLGQYLTDVNALIANPKTHLYIDSSFLVWALKLGQTSIGEFVGFLESAFPDRIHVPLWTAHEFQHHLVKSTATDQAKKAIDDMEGAGRRLYPELAPLLSEASDPPNRDQSQLRLAARDAFIELSSIAKILQAWMKENSEASRSALITFINAHCLKSDLVFDYLQSLDELATNRFDARVPPGFQDRGKKEKAKGTESKSVEPSNFAGDLIFWREILAHTRKLNRFRVKAQNILLLTDDGKNDWVVGGGNAARPENANFSDIDTTWDPIPVAHPMLQFEAVAHSRVERVVLINRKLLGALLHERKVAGAYVNAAFNTALPAGVQKKRKKQTTAPPRPDGEGGDVVDKPLAEATPTAALVAVPDAVAVLNELVFSPDKNWLNVVLEALEIAAFPQLEGGGLGFNEIFESILKAKTLHLAGYLARGLMREAQAGQSSSADEIQNVLASLDEIEPAIAAWFYAGVLVEKYLTTEGAPHIAPSTVLLDQLVSHEGAKFAGPAIGALRRVIADGRLPLYVPDPDSKALGIKISGSSSLGGAQKLKSIFVGNIDVHDPATSDEGAALWKLLGFQEPGPDMKALASEIAGAARRYFGLPISRSQLATVDQEFSISAHDGFALPEQESI